MKPNDFLYGVRRVTFPKREDAMRRVLFLLRDPGDANCLRPVLNAILNGSRDDLAPSALVAGWDSDNFDPKAFVAEPRIAPFERWEEAPAPDVVVTSSSCSDPHLQVGARLAYPRAKMLYVEDNYQQSGKLFAALKKNCQALPDRICCIDGASLEDSSAGYPELDRRVYTTSQPVFEAVVNEDEAVRTEARRKLGLAETVRLAVYMGASDNGALVKELAAALKTVRWGFKPIFTVRCHPRDATGASSYAEIFDAAGLSYLDTAEHDTTTVARAADLVLAVVSTELTIAALRGIPAAHLLDGRHGANPGTVRFPLPHSRAGAVEMCRTVEDAVAFARRILDPASKEEIGWVERFRQRQRQFRARHPRNAAANIIAHIRELAS